MFVNHLQNRDLKTARLSQRESEAKPCKTTASDLHDIRGEEVRAFDLHETSQGVRHRFGTIFETQKILSR
jgi:hypothetical protein